MSDKQVPSESAGGVPDGLNAGDVIADKYKVLRVLGRGGYGTVYLVEIVSGMVGQKLALKLVSRGVSSDEKVQRRFINEIRVAMKLVNKYIIQIRDVGTTDVGQLYYTMDFSPGFTLSRVIKTEGALGIARSCLITLRILRGLFTAQDQGVIHRDLKPANIMVEQDDGKETIKILDFGIATAVQDQPRKSKTFVGSPYYMPPEQFLGEGLGTWSDLYSVGVILFECLTGTRPYSGSSAREVFEDIKSRPVESPRSLNPELNQCLPVVRVALKALERKPESRYQTAREFFNELNSAYENYKVKVTGGAPPSKPRPRPAAKASSGQSSAQAPRPRRSTRRASSGAASTVTWLSLIVVGLGVAYMIYSKSSNRPPPPPKMDDPVVNEPVEAPSRENMFEDRVGGKKNRATDPAAPASTPEDREREARQLYDETFAKWKEGSLNQSDLKAIRESCTRIRHLDGQYAPPYELLGHVEVSLELWDDAYRSYVTALSLYEASGKTEISDELYKNLALTRIYGSPSERDEMFLHLRIAVELDPRNEEITVALVELLEAETKEAGRPSELMELLETAKSNGITHLRIDELHEKYFVTLPRAEKERIEKLRSDVETAYSNRDYKAVVDIGSELFVEDPSTELGLRLATAHRERYEFQRALDMLYTVMNSLARLGDKRAADPEFLSERALDFVRVHILSFESGERDSRGALEDALTNLTTAADMADTLGKKGSTLLAYARSYRARCYLHLGERDRLMTELKKLRSSSGKDPFLGFHQGETLYRLGQETPDRSLRNRYYGQAVSSLDRAGRLVSVRKDPGLAREIFNRLGVVYYELGGRTNINRSNTAFKNANKARLETAELYMNWARTFVKLKKKREAARKFSESYHAEPSIDACHDAAYWFYSSKVRKSALEMLEIGLARFPKSRKLQDLMDIIDASG